ncbi:MAG TPA: hypothetical protein VKT33_07050 [Candidatus Angelobacter sp.]|nr:hypothetical protein [Candidatus Angelobacter sp.]
MTTATLNLGEIAAFWRIARRLHVIYAELNRTFEIGLPPCRDLEYPADRSEPEVLERVRGWFDQMDAHVHVWQLRQLLQSTSLQTEENLRDLVARHLSKKQKSEIDRDKIDFLLVQYFAHCAPHGLYEQRITLAEVARVLEPVVGPAPAQYAEWAGKLDLRLEKLNECSSLEQLQDSGALVEVRELKLAIGAQYFAPGSMIVFTRFNFLARRAFFRAMHLDLHAIHEAVNQLEARGFSAVDCSEASLGERESLEHIRHIIHQWKTPFRAPYSGGSSFLQLIQLRHVLDEALHEMPAPGSSAPRPVPSAPVAGQSAAEKIGPELSKIFAAAPEAMPAATAPAVVASSEKKAVLPVPSSEPKATVQEFSVEALHEHTVPEIVIKPEPVMMEDAAIEPKAGETAVPAEAPQSVEKQSVEKQSVETPQSVEAPPEEDDYLHYCIKDITGQLNSAPRKATPSPSPITLGGCKLLIATWEATAFTEGTDQLSQGLRDMVAARTILHVALERHKKGEPTDIALALEIAEKQVEEMRGHIAAAKETKNVDAAVNLAATTRRMLALTEEARKLLN